MEKGNPEPKAGQGSSKNPPPVIFEAGSQSKKAINKLKAGRGELKDRVDEAIEQVRCSLPDQDKNKPIITVLVIYKKKKKRTSSLPLSPFSCFSPLNFLR